MKKYLLIVIWDLPIKEAGDRKNIYTYWDYNRAVSAMNGMKMALGNQIAWIGISEG